LSNSDQPLCHRDKLTVTLDIW